MIKFTDKRNNIRFDREVIGYPLPAIADEWYLLRVKAAQDDRIFKEIELAILIASST
ncbi:hypothetical protein [Budvicia diplopodorum]|uniref:hypothetical protein n=1 Tax=Budvicia diplopodorum TaxID=1119056 RepID=UPI001356F113|nr:hypothetical protein [Budvicia diplopodorum]